MKRMALFLTEKQIERLKNLSKQDGLPVAEIVRRAIDDYLSKMGV